MKAYLAAACLLWACDGDSPLAHPELFEPDDDASIGASKPQLDARVDARMDAHVDARMDATIVDAFVDNTPDARLEADGGLTPGWVVEVEGRMCSTPNGSWCGLPNATVDLRGQSPFGPLQIDRIGVAYLTGYLVQTVLILTGTAGEHAVELQASIDTKQLNENPLAPLAIPGRYEGSLPESSYNHLSTRVYYCDKVHQLDQSVLTVDESRQVEQNSLVLDDTEIRFRGTLTLSEGDWSLSAPFSLDFPCAGWIVD